MDRTTATSKQHQDGINRAKLWLTDQDYDLKPLPTIRRSQPDVYGEKKQNGFLYKIIIEVETEDSITDPHSKEQMNDFLNWTKEYNNCKIVLFIPKHVLEDAKKELPFYSEYKTF